MTQLRTPYTSMGGRYSPKDYYSCETSKTARPLCTRKVGQSHTDNDSHGWSIRQVKDALRLTGQDCMAGVGIHR